MAEPSPKWLRRTCWLGILAWACAASLVAQQAAAQEDSPGPNKASSTAPKGRPDTPTFAPKARVGFGMFHPVYKLGHWTPVEVTVQGGPRTTSGEMTLAVADGDGVAGTVTRLEQSPAGADKRVRFISRLGRDAEPLHVLFRWEDGSGIEGVSEGAIENESSSLAPGQQLCIMLGQAGLNRAAEELKLRWHEGEQPAVVRWDDFLEVPAQWYGLEAVDVIVLTTSKPELYQRLGDAQRDALAEWVRQGGKLVISAGSKSRELLIPGGKLHEFVPGRLEDFHELNRSQGFDELAQKGSGQISSRLFTKGERVSVPFIKDVDGQVLAREFDLPLVIRRAFGFGEVVFVAADMDSRPFQEWADLPRFYQTLLEWPAEDSKQTDAQGQFISHRVSDHLSQLLGGLDEFPGVQLAPFALVAALIIIYIVLIGPADFFFVKKVLRRMELTWVTFPAIVLAVSVGAYSLAAWLKGDKLRVNQAAVVDVDLSRKNEAGESDPYVRGTVWLNVFSPATARYDLTLEPVLPPGEAAEKPTVLLGWLGLPENALGGMVNQSGSWAVHGPQYALNVDAGTIGATPIQVWSTKALTARWRLSGAELASGELVGTEDELRSGSVTSHLDVPLEGAFLAYGKYLYPLEGLPAGKPVEVPLRNRQELANRLKGTHLVTHETDYSRGFENKKYDPRSKETFDTLEKMMFYRQVGGESYTSLRNSYQNFIDLSGHLKLGRAIVVGRTNQPSARLLANGQPLAGPAEQQAWTWYRFVLPVKKADSRL